MAKLTFCGRDRESKWLGNLWCSPRSFSCERKKHTTVEQYCSLPTHACGGAWRNVKGVITQETPGIWCGCVCGGGGISTEEGDKRLTKVMYLDLV